MKEEIRMRKEKILADIRKRHEESLQSSLISGDRRQYDVGFLLQYIDDKPDLREFLKHEIKMAETADAFIDYATGYADALRMVLKRVEGL